MSSLAHARRASVWTGCARPVRAIGLFGSSRGSLHDRYGARAPCLHRSSTRRPQVSAVANQPEARRGLSSWRGTCSTSDQGVIAMKKSNKIRKLALQHETVAPLVAADLDNVFGGQDVGG